MTFRESHTNRIHLVRVNNDDVRDAMNRLMSRLGLPAECNRPIGIKVNLCDYRKRETGVTTDPLVLDPLLMFLRNRYPSSRIFLFEHDATGTLADNLFTWLGLDSVANRYDVEIVNLAREKWTNIPIKGYHFREIEVPNLLLESLIVNHPKMKTHGRTKITCGLKNMFACYRIKEKVKYHAFLDEGIVDINQAIKTDYTVVDGVLALEGNRGPTQGFPKRLGVLVGGKDIVAVDALCARFMGFNPRSVGHIAKACKAGVGSMSFDIDSEIPEDEFRRYKFQFSVPKFWLMQLLRKVLQ